MIVGLNQILRGWPNYFKYVAIRGPVHI
ncbi:MULTISPECIES: group II intron maturase-specific domain-containing protein [unclassified Nocardia]